ncbi:hypothetical protein M758_9G015500 [Ceratodon purpureus]|nr:hypothetical protein M758_9G015500 [Ceratodon purpureus]
MEWALGGLGPVTVEGAVLRGPSRHGMGALTVMLPFPRVCFCVSVCFLRHTLVCSHPSPALSLSPSLLLLRISTLPISNGGGSLFRHQHLGPCGQDICGLRWRRLRLHEARLPQGESADSCQALGYGIFGERGGCCGCVSEGLPCCRVLPDGSGGEFLADS